LFANENCEKKEEALKAAPVYTLPAPVAEPKAKPELVEEDEEPEPKKKSKKQKDGKQTTLFGFFEKIQNFGGTMFNDEE
jgi:hypothetical protein